MSRWKERLDPACGAATQQLMEKTGFSQAQLGKILNCDPSEVSRAAKGYRPFATVLARLYIMTDDKAFAPKNPLEKERFDKERASLVPSLKKYLEKGVPESKVAKDDPSDLTAKFIIILQTLGDILGVDWRDIRELAQGILGEKQSRPSEVIESPWFDRLMSGVSEVSGQQLGGVRFVLTEGSFRPLKGQFTPAEVQDTRLLLQELRRRINLVTQLQNKAARAQILKKLAPEIRELYLAIERSKDADPSRTAERISQLRKLTALKGAGER